MFFITTGDNIHLAVAELITVLEEKVEIVFMENQVIIFDTPLADIESKIINMGSMIKFGEIYAKELQENQLEENLITEILKNYADKKLNFALNYFNRNNLDLGFDLKRELKKQGLKVRFVKGKKKVLNSAEVKHNRLTEKNKGVDCNIFWLDNQYYYLGTTKLLQDFEGFSYRDYERPHRDMFNGMLPPKLARMMINLSGFQSGETVYDPFCGNGTVLMETILMDGYAVGSDIKKEKVASTKENLEFLNLEKFKLFDLNVLNLNKINNSFWNSIDKIVFE